MKPKISLITLGVKDIQKSLTFYRDGLGFSTYKYNEGDDHVMFEMEGSWLGIFPIDQLAKGANISNNKGLFSGIEFAHNVSSKEEVDKLFKLVIEAGATELKEPVDVYWGGYESHFSDPDGYVWAITYNPYTDLT